MYQNNKTLAISKMLINKRYHHRSQKTSRRSQKTSHQNPAQDLIMGPTPLNLHVLSRGGTPAII